LSLLRTRGVPCRDCRQPMPVGAKICLNCRAYQDWRRYLSIGQANLALLIAFISVLSSAVPVLNRVMTEDDSFLDTSFQAADNDTVTLIASNLGTRPGTIRGGYIFVGSRDQTWVPLSLANSSVPLIVEPGKSILVTFNDRAYLASGTEIYSLPAEEKCEVSPQFSSFKGKYGVLSRDPMDCDLLRPFILKFQRPTDRVTKPDASAP
jgi:hypothetical protein